MLKLFCDRRILPERYYMAEEEESMYIPPQVLKCVAFIYCHRQDRPKPEPWGTVSFISLLDASSEAQPQRSWHYAITARHILDDIRKYSRHKEIVYFRMNKKNGPAKLIETKTKDWVLHPTDDVAVLPWEPPTAEFDILEFQIPGYIGEELFPYRSSSASNVQVYMPSIGDEVFIAGLFSPCEGAVRNTPIVRVGNIAAMKGDVEIEPGITKNLFLIEARSTGGLSGSPVFVMPGIVKGEGLVMTDQAGRFAMIGVIHAHWDEQKSSRLKELRDVNMGIAMVVPFNRVEDVLRNRVLVEQRKRVVEEESMAKKYTAKMDSSQLGRSVVEAAIGEPLTTKRKAKKATKKARKHASK